MDRGSTSIPGRGKFVTKVLKFALDCTLYDFVKIICDFEVNEVNHDEHAQEQ